jgi:hypothetical protein
MRVRRTPRLSSLLLLETLPMWQPLQFCFYLWVASLAFIQYLFLFLFLFLCFDYLFIYLFIFLLFAPWHLAASHGDFYN